MVIRHIGGLVAMPAQWSYFWGSKIIFYRKNDILKLVTCLYGGFYTSEFGAKNVKQKYYSFDTQSFGFSWAIISLSISNNRERSLPALVSHLT